MKDPKYNPKILLMVVLAAITIFGLVTGRYLFLVFMFPLGLGLFKRRKQD
ncbi:hypothetical protein L3X39_04800 [Sabulilitoribacter multivorans]|uniref:AI-2E family transporter n=1 Tax=Flaviramulus multivorans TaxID=1304750 RepID=A0ABS9IGQ5_9FLAO|nr:hypothetical protein [Flaviramulus multivorans]MCF7559948.1 hypothetical protein [Flaviramulus multivorans]